MRALIISAVILVGACKGKRDPCAELRAKVCAGVDSAACGRLMATMDAPFAGAIDQVSLTDEQRDTACALLLDHPRIKKMPTGSDPKEAVDEALLRGHDGRATAPELAAQPANDAAAAQAILTKLEHDLADLEPELTKATAAIAAAKGDTDLDAAKVGLDLVEKQISALEGRITEAGANLARAARLQGVSKECLDNPLAKGC